MINKYLKAIRLPNILIVVLTITIIYLKFNNEIIDKYAILLMISISMITAAGYLINDYFDIKADKINKPKKLIIGKYIKPRWAIILHWVLNFIGSTIGLYIAYLEHSYFLVFIFLITPYILWMYSIKLKKTFLAGNLTTSLLTALVPYIAFYTIKITEQSNQKDEITICIFILFAFLSNLIREIQKDIIDVKGDKKINCNTIPIKLGIDKTKEIIISLLLSEVICLFLSYQFIVLEKTIFTVLFYFLIVLIISNIYFTLKGTTSKQFYLPSMISKTSMIIGLILIYLL